ncbi:hypothetical protein FKW77_005565 [Venturia effusa]|uniref:F-box domain-containing protein n=1 Tax=Venturia effusa TaxID=50376 RepID=A0A517LK92_9PEZI|nr:hypothetical protein FKW77_005565 [Venturia effusa]
MANPRRSPLPPGWTYASVVRQLLRSRALEIPHTPNFPDSPVVVSSLRTSEFPPLGASRSYQPISFLDLPGEIRNCIYRFALTQTHRNLIHLPPSFYISKRYQDVTNRESGRPALELLRTNHQVWQEATEFLYKAEFAFYYPYWHSKEVLDCVSSMGRNVTLVEGVLIECVELNDWRYDDGTYDNNVYEWLGLLGTSTRCQSFGVLHISLPYSNWNWPPEFNVNFNENFFNGRELARLLFPTLRPWFENMDQGNQDWKSSFMANQDTVILVTCSKMVSMSLDRSKFFAEIERLLQGAGGMWMGVLDGEATVLWTEMNCKDWSGEWEQLPVRKGSCRMEWWLPATQGLRRSFHLGNTVDA